MITEKMLIEMSQLQSLVRDLEMEITQAKIRIAEISDIAEMSLGNKRSMTVGKFFIQERVRNKRSYRWKVWLIERGVAIPQWKDMFIEHFGQRAAYEMSKPTKVRSIEIRNAPTVHDVPNG